jgi:hypothetical protein
VGCGRHPVNKNVLEYLGESSRSTAAPCRAQAPRGTRLLSRRAAAPPTQEPGPTRRLGVKAPRRFLPMPPRPSTIPKERMGVGRRAFPHPSLSRARTGMTTPITNAYDNSCVYLQIGEPCAARRHIACRNGSPGGTFSGVMCRYTIHRPQKCAAICAISVAYVAYNGAFRPYFDERTHDRTHENPRKRRTNPGIRRTNPRFCKRTRGTTCRTHGPGGRADAAIRPAGRPWRTGCQRWP